MPRLTEASAGVGRAELPACGRVCWCRASSDAHIQRGSPMTQSNRRPSSRAASALVFVSALLLAPALFRARRARRCSVTLRPSRMRSRRRGDRVGRERDARAAAPRRRCLQHHEAPGTIVIDTGNTALYYVLGQGRAIRYGVGVGREGFTWSGVQTISRKAEWPDWHPPAEMIARQPYLPRFMAGGRAIRSAPAPCISAPANTAFTAPTIPRRSASSSRPAASA